MADQEGGRWDVGIKDNEIYIARISDSDERIFYDLIAPQEARDLAGLLTKYADKADGSEGSDEEDDEKSRDDDEDDEDDEDEDEDEDDEDDEDDEKDDEKDDSKSD